LPAAQIFSQRLAEDAIPALHWLFIDLPAIVSAVQKPRKDLSNAYSGKA
jgi:hypothetical protein